MELTVRFHRASDLLAQEAHVARGAFFLPVPSPAPEPLTPLTLVVEGPDGAIVSFAARVVQIAPGAGMAVALDDAKSDGAKLKGLFDAARALPPIAASVEVVWPVEVEWGTGAAKAAAPSEPEPSSPAEDGDGGGDAPETDETRALADQIRAMSVPEKMTLAKKGDRTARLFLMKDPVKAVHMFVIQNPRITIEEIIYIAGYRQTNPEVLNVIAASKEWTQNPRVVGALVRNPKTPSSTAVRLLDRLPMSEIRRLARSSDVPRPISQAAKKKALTSPE